MPLTGAVLSQVKLARTGTEHEKRSTALELGRLAAASDANKLAILDHGGVTGLVSLALQPDSHTVAFAVEAISEMLTLTLCHEAFVHAGCIRSLFATCHDAGPSIAGVAITALRHLARVEPYAIIMAESGGLKELTMLALRQDLDDLAELRLSELLSMLSSFDEVGWGAGFLDARTRFLGLKTNHSLLTILAQPLRRCHASKVCNMMVAYAGMPNALARLAECKGDTCCLFDVREFVLSLVDFVSLVAACSSFSSFPATLSLATFLSLPNVPMTTLSGFRLLGSCRCCGRARSRSLAAENLQASMESLQTLKVLGHADAKVLRSHSVVKLLTSTERRSARGEMDLIVAQLVNRCSEVS